MARSDGEGEKPSKRQKRSPDITNRSDESNYEVGYRKPPARNRWAKGQSGNPYGRPRKKDKEPFARKIHPLRDMIFDELERPVAIKEGGQTIEIETLRAILRSVNVGAIKGNRTQQKLALDIASAAQESRRADLENLVLNVETYKQQWEPIFERAARNGGPEPRQLPHPDHVDIDPLTCEIVFTGPQTRAEKKAWDHLKFQLRESQRMLFKLRADAAANPRSRRNKEICELADKHVRKLEKMVPRGWNWRENLGWEEAYAKRIFDKLKGPGSETS